MISWTGSPSRRWLVMLKMDYKKDCKDIYLPKAVPAVIDVPPMSFIMVDGRGDPKGEE